MSIREQQRNTISTKSDLRDAVQNPSTLVSKNSVSDNKLILRINDELMDCERSTIELYCCTAYIADSLTFVLEILHDSLIADLNSKVVSSQEYSVGVQDNYILQELLDDVAFQKDIKEDLINSQKYFFKYLDAELKLVGSSHDGNGRILHQDRIEVQLLENRIADLKELFWWNSAD